MTGYIPGIYTEEDRRVEEEIMAFVGKHGPVTPQELKAYALGRNYGTSTRLLTWQEAVWRLADRGNLEFTNDRKFKWLKPLRKQGDSR